MLHLSTNSNCVNSVNSSSDHKNVNHSYGNISSDSKSNQLNNHSTNEHIVNNKNVNNNIAANPYKTIASYGTGIVIGQLNICSLSEHFDDLNYILNSDSFDVFGLNETFLSDEISDINISVENYYLYRKDRKSGSRGGVAFYVHNQCSHV